MTEHDNRGLYNPARCPWCISGGLLVVGDHVECVEKACGFRLKIDEKADEEQEIRLRDKWGGYSTRDKVNKRWAFWCATDRYMVKGCPVLAWLNPTADIKIVMAHLVPVIDARDKPQHNCLNCSRLVPFEWWSLNGMELRRDLLMETRIEAYERSRSCDDLDAAAERLVHRMQTAIDALKKAGIRT